MLEGGRLLGGGQANSRRERSPGTPQCLHAATTGGGEEASWEQIQGPIQGPVCTFATGTHS